MNRIRELRKESALTMKELGCRVGVAESTISLYETEKHDPDLKTLIKIADFFRVSTDYLLGREFSAEDKASEVSLTKKISITPLEDDMLYAFREIGKKFGMDTQKAAVLLLENVTGIKL